eukprot:TRINITY_DN37243_c0_g1_i1.p1 TRINITY_DN37243_c0_g1~~TRINITY_DN37243_c0_g1_i1.p1  ORF type:complete len:357 (+),score=80.85 TRINITY_DN37243_c0_g1_i1:210-1280(+)
MSYGYGYLLGGMATFNVNDGYPEALVRGFRSGILTVADYGNLAQCDVLDDIKLHLSTTDYGNFLQNEPSPLATNVIAEKCVEKLVDEFNHLRAHCSEPLSTFLDFITYGYMIDNIVLILTGTLHNRDASELMEKIHPLGKFEAMETLCTASSPSDLYNTVLVDTPLAPYFLNCLSTEDLDDLNIEVIRNVLYKEYLEAFYKYCQGLGGVTAEVMCRLLEFEADRRAINITINSFGTELSKDDRPKMFPRFGQLYPQGMDALAKADDMSGVHAAVEHVSEYRAMLNEVSFNSDKSLENCFFEHEVKLHKDSFEQQMHYAVFYSYIKLREQEIRNIVWIAECISQDQKAKIASYIGIF